MQLMTVNNALQQSDTAATGNAFCQRDANGDLTNRQTISTRAMKSSGGLYVGIATKTVTFTADDLGTTYICDATAGNITANLPAAATVSGQVFSFVKKDVSANTITIDGNAAETINGAATKVLTAQYDKALIQSDGSNWFIIG